jgi:predicted transposase YbfD/YdcC
MESEHSNEQTALPRLVEQLDLAVRIVSIDAIGYLPRIARQIKEQDGEYVLALIAKQGTMYQDMVNLFDVAETTGFADWGMTCIIAWTKSTDGWNTASIGPLRTPLVSPI